MVNSTEAEDVTGTRDENYNLIWFTETCLSNAVRLESYISGALMDGDDELVDLFTRAQFNSTKGAEEAKALLRSRL